MDVAISEPHIVVPEAADADAAWLLVITATSFNLRSAPSPPVEAFIGACMQPNWVADPLMRAQVPTMRSIR